MRLAMILGIGVAFGSGFQVGTQTLPSITAFTINPDTFLVNTATVMTVQARLTGAVAPTVVLERLDEQGAVVTVDATLVDTGDPAAGDAAAGDGIYSGRRTHLVATPTAFGYRVRATAGGVGATSATIAVHAVAPVTPFEAQTIVNLQTSALQSYRTAIATQPPAAATGLALARLRASADVIAADASPDSSGIWIVYRSGLLGSISLHPSGSLGGAGAATNAALMSSTPFPQSAPTAPTAGSVATEPAVRRNAIGNSNVLLLSPFATEFKAVDPTPALKTLFEARGCSRYRVTHLTDGAVTVDQLRSLTNYGVIALYGHGGTFFGYMNRYAPALAAMGRLQRALLRLESFPDDGIVEFVTGERVVANSPKYSVELKRGQVAIGSINGIHYYAILPGFIRQQGPGFQGRGFQNSLVFSAACRSTHNPSMATAFVENGAGAYLGFSNYVEPSFAAARVKDFFSAWLTDPSRSTAGRAYVPSEFLGVKWQFFGNADLEAQPLASGRCGFYDFGETTTAPSGPAQIGPLVQDASGNVYGATTGGGTNQQGTIFKFNPQAGTMGVVHAFKGVSPYWVYDNIQGGLSLGSDGNLYGSTYSGGKWNVGTVFRISPNGGGVTVLRDFRNGTTTGLRSTRCPPTGPCALPLTPRQKADAAGGRPVSPPVLASDGNLYGVTRFANNSESGVLYRIDPRRGADDEMNFQTLCIFAPGVPTNHELAPFVCPIRAYEAMSLILGTDNGQQVLYGTTAYGVTPGQLTRGGNGTIFKATLAGQVSLIHAFQDPTLGSVPIGLMQSASDGRLYGTNFRGGPGQYGVLYSLDPSKPGTAPAVLQSFRLDATTGTGYYPISAVSQGPEATLYGVAERGGRQGGGVLYSISPSGQGFKVLFEFSGKNNGSLPVAAPVVDKSGETLFGTTFQGGEYNKGVLYRLFVGR